MKIVKRSKKSRIRGARTCGYGFRQKHKGGKGNKGGSGMAGSGKRADHKKQKALRIAKSAGAKNYFGKRGFTSSKTEKKREKKINLRDIVLKFNGEKEINLIGYKILGEGKGFKGEIKATSASKSAIEKMNNAGGKIIIANKRLQIKKEDK